MPHCCPQKQQCVLTIRSGSTSAFQPLAGIRFRVGPNCATSSGIVTGGLAINFSLILKQRLSPLHVHAIYRPVPWPAICAGKQDTHPDNGRRSKADNGYPATAGHLSNRQYAAATQTTHRSAGILPVQSARLLPYKTERRSALAAGKCERTFQKADRAG